ERSAAGPTAGTRRGGRAAALGRTAPSGANATLRGLHESMRNLDQSRPACKSLANKPLRRHRPVPKQAPAWNGNSFIFWLIVGGVDGTRTRGLRRDRPAF